MTITLDHIVPKPIADKVLSRSSDVWNQTVLLQPGEWIKVKAPSGSGKTTLVHVLWQMRKDYEGHVLYDGVNAQQIAPEKMALIRQEKLSVVFQDLRLFGQLTALENIELKRRMPRQPYYEISRVYEMAEVLGVSHVLGQSAATCSYGEQQRIAIIRSLMQPFNWLIMDEPFSHLDIANTSKASALILEECKKRNAGLLITDLDEDTNFPYTRFLNL
jgi:putative ABC transport system ATP-binding protein